VAKKKNNSGRRTVLKTLGAGIAGLGSAGLVQGSNDHSSKEPMALMKEAQQVLQQNGPEARASFLESHGIKTTSKGISVSRPTSDGSVSTNSIDCIEPTRCGGDGDIEVNISMAFLPTYSQYHVSLQFRYQYVYGITLSGYYDYSGPERPLDGTGLYWNPDEYQIENTTLPGESMTVPDHGSWDNGSWNVARSGSGFRVDDLQVCYDSGSYGDDLSEHWSDWDSCGVMLVPQADHSSSSLVKGEYVYAWNDDYLSPSVSASYPLGIGVSFSGSSSVQKEDLATNLQGEALAVSSSDAIRL